MRAAFLMMSQDRFFVLWPDGQKFGPADIPTLQRWAIENRIGPATLLEDAQTMRQVRAVDIQPLQAVLNLPMNTPYPQQGFVPANPNAGTTEVTIAWILGAVGLLAACCAGPLPAIAGIVLAAIAVSKRQPNAMGALIFNICVVVISLLVIGFFSIM